MVRNRQKALTILLLCILPWLGGCAEAVVYSVYTVSVATEKHARERTQKERDAREAARLAKALGQTTDKLPQCLRQSRPLPDGSDIQEMDLPALREAADQGYSQAQTEMARELYWRSIAGLSDGKEKSASVRRMAHLGMHFAQCAAGQDMQALGIMGLYQLNILKDKAAAEQSLRQGAREGVLEALVLLRTWFVTEVPLSSGRELAALDEMILRVNQGPAPWLDDTPMVIFLERSPRPEAISEPDFDALVPPFAVLNAPAAQALVFRQLQAMLEDLPQCRSGGNGKSRAMLQNRLPGQNALMGIHLTLLQEDKKLADHGSLEGQRMLALRLQKFAEAYPQFAQTLRAPICHYYACAEQQDPNVGEYWACYLATRGEYAAAEKVMRHSAARGSRWALELLLDWHKGKKTRFSKADKKALEKMLERVSQEKTPLPELEELLPVLYPETESGQGR